MLQNRKGFTLIELLIVVVIIGILAAVAIPRFGESRERAYISAMQSDLRQILTAHEIYYSDNGYEYAEELDETTLGTLLNVTLSTGVNLDSYDVSDSGQGWFAALWHNAIGENGTKCAVFVGDYTGDTAPAQDVGVIRCSDGDDD